MAKTIPTAFADAELNAGNLTLGEDILGANWRSIIEQQNYFFAHTGARNQGIIFPTAATTTSGTLTQVNSTSGGRNLDTWFGGFDPLRTTLNSTGKVRINFRTYSQNCTVTFTIYRLTDGATVTTQSVTNSSTAAWASSTLELSASSYKVPLGIKAQFLATSGTASLWQWSVQEEVITSTAYLPAG